MIMRSKHSRKLFFTAVACAVLAATGCRAVCSADPCEEPAAERGRLLDRRPLAGHLAEFQAKCADHFAEEPVVAPHPRFHPVPTRPVFAPVPPEELAVLLAPVEAAAPGKAAVVTDSPTTTKLPAPAAAPKAAPNAELPPPEASPTEPSPIAPPTRTAHGDIPSKPKLRPISTHAEPGRSQVAPAVEEIHSTFELQPEPMPLNAPLPPDEHTMDETYDDEPLLWRAIPTPAGSLRAIPADAEFVP